jgi:hypothetical protein
MKAKENAHIDTGIYNKNIISTSLMSFQDQLSHISGAQFKWRGWQYLLQSWLGVLRIITNCSKLKTYGVRVYSKFRKNRSTESNLEQGYTYIHARTQNSIVILHPILSLLGGKVSSKYT